MADPSQYLRKVTDQSTSGIPMTSNYSEEFSQIRQMSSCHSNNRRCKQCTRWSQQTEGYPQKGVQQQQVSQGHQSCSWRNSAKTESWEKSEIWSPDFIPKKFKLIDAANNDRPITVIKEGHGSKYIRHPHDIKLFRGILTNTANGQLSEQNDIKDFHWQLLEMNLPEKDEDGEGDKWYPQNTPDVHRQYYLLLYY